MSLGVVWVSAGVASTSTATAESGIKYIRRFTRSLLPILPTSPRIVTKRKRLEKASKDTGQLGLGAIYVRGTGSAGCAGPVPRPTPLPERKILALIGVTTIVFNTSESFRCFRCNHFPQRQRDESRRSFAVVHVEEEAVAPFRLVLNPRGSRRVRIGPRKAPRWFEGRFR